MAMKTLVSAGTALLALLLAQSPVIAQYATGFENVTASPGGFPLTGQDGFYLPSGTQNVDFLVHTYSNNPFGIPLNPHGENQFAMATAPGGSSSPRAQRDIPYGCARRKWTAACDVLGRFGGTLPATQNLGSFSLQPSTTAASFIALARWQDLNNPSTWNADYVYFDSAGTQVTGPVPHPGFQGLAVDHWYRWETDFDLTTNAIIELRLLDLTSDDAWTHQPVGWYLRGGAAGGVPAPTAFRLFTGGTTFGNLMAFDNVALFPDPGATRILYGCGVNQPGSLTLVRGRPVTGGVLEIGIDNPLGTQAPGSLPFLALGLTRDPMAPCGSSIPGVAGELLIGTILDARLGPIWTGPGNRARVPVAIPVNCDLVGFTVFAQGAMFDPLPGAAVPVSLTSAMEISIGEDATGLIVLENLSGANLNSYSQALRDAFQAGGIQPGTPLDSILQFLANNMLVGSFGNRVLDPAFAPLLQMMNSPSFNYRAWADSFEQPLPGQPDNLVIPQPLLALEAALQGAEHQPFQAGFAGGGGNVCFQQAGKTKQEALDCETNRHNDMMAEMDRARAICAAAAAALGAGLGIWSLGIGAVAGVIALAACETAYADAAKAEKRRHTANNAEIRRKYGGC